MRAAAPSRPACACKPQPPACLPSSCRKADQISEPPLLLGADLRAAGDAWRQSEAGANPRESSLWWKLGRVGWLGLCRLAGWLAGWLDEVAGQGAAQLSMVAQLALGVC
jgi:hypothetical protein